ncbi:hypothetical protein [Hymenobacter terrenus]|uniref:hypothetical protein n=1 Tax=Hymenobacter terrenus TaxID=1629124 RepID=UPI000619C9D1|nr:hypothetical protein [Hymenobacter terrenus]
MISDDNLPPQDDEDDEDARMPGYNQYNQDEADKYQAQADTDASIASDVLNNTRYDEFFAAYQPTVREDFARRYVMYRGRWVEDGEQNERRPARHLNLHEKEAYLALWTIQQKKLFDLQCQWRAEEVRELPDVAISNDFGRLTHIVENYPALSPITADEFALFMAWVKQADYESNFNDSLDQRFGWQQYRLVKETLAPDAPPVATRAVPTVKLVSDWYRFHNEHTGNGRLLYLPDVRGAKEERYWNAWREGEREREEIKQAAGPPPDPRPEYLPEDQHRTLARDFAQRFEPPRLNRWREISELLHPPVSEEERKFNVIVARMQMMTEPVPIAAGPDWRTATREAFFAHCHRKLLECLPQVYAEYVQRQEWGIAQPSRFEDGWDPLKYDITPLYRGWLLDGRARLGEPQDFDF